VSLLFSSLAVFIDSLRVLLLMFQLAVEICDKEHACVHVHRVHHEIDDAERDHSLVSQSEDVENLH